GEGPLLGGFRPTFALGPLPFAWCGDASEPVSPRPRATDPLAGAGRPRDGSGTGSRAPGGARAARRGRGGTRVRPRRRTVSCGPVTGLASAASNRSPSLDPRQVPRGG